MTANASYSATTSCPDPTISRDLRWTTQSSRADRLQLNHLWVAVRSEWRLRGRVSRWLSPCPRHRDRASRDRFAGLPTPQLVGPTHPLIDRNRQPMTYRLWPDGGCKAVVSEQQTPEACQWFLHRTKTSKDSQPFVHGAKERAQG